MKVKVLLQSDVKGIGKKGQIVEVSRGYATNYLLPKKLAVIATDEVIKNAKAQEEATKRKIEKEKKEAMETAQKLDNRQIVISRKAGETGKLFGSITAKEIAEILKEQFGVSVDRKSIEIPNPIKSIGEFEIYVDFGFGYKAKMLITVNPE